MANNASIHTVSKPDTCAGTQLVSQTDPFQLWCQLEYGTKFLYDIGLLKNSSLRRNFSLYQAVSQIEGEKKGIGQIRPTPASHLPKADWPLPYHYPNLEGRPGAESYTAAR